MILLICLIVQRYGYSQVDTIYKINKSSLVKIYNNLTICDTSLVSCKAREVFYLKQLRAYERDETLYLEVLDNDSVIIEQTTLKVNELRNKNKNLEKSNNLFKLLCFSELGGLIITIILLVL